MREARWGSFAVGLSLAFASCGSSDDDATPATHGSAATEGNPAEPSSSRCTSLSDEEIAALVGDDFDNWKGSGTVTVTSAEKTPTTGTDFTNIVFLSTDQGDFTFAVDGDDVANPDGLLVGADEATRASWTWGDAATPDSPIAAQAAEAVSAAGSC